MFYRTSFTLGFQSPCIWWWMDASEHLWFLTFHWVLPWVSSKWSWLPRETAKHWTGSLVERVWALADSGQFLWCLARKVPCLSTTRRSRSPHSKHRSYHHRNHWQVAQDWYRPSTPQQFFSACYWISHNQNLQSSHNPTSNKTVTSWRSRFSGLISRWMVSSLCRWYNPSHTCLTILDTFS